jgi:putative SOS response-associated peptidase YedK
MPAILQGQAIEDWLNTGEVSALEAASLAKPPEAGAMKYHPVGKAVGRADAEGPELIEPIDPSIDVEEDPRRRKKVANGQLSLF